MFFHLRDHHKMLFAFLPWVSFWPQAGMQLPDYAHLRAAVAKADSHCKKTVKEFRITVVKSNESRSKGLGGRQTPLAKDEGMLFVFERPQKVSFWMKDTFIPLEIAYFDGRGKLTQLFEMPVDDHPDNPSARYNSSMPVSTALEIAPATLKGVPARSVELCIDSVVR